VHTALHHNQIATITLLRKVIVKKGGTFLVLHEEEIDSYLSKIQRNILKVYLKIRILRKNIEQGTPNTEYRKLFRVMKEVGGESSISTDSKSLTGFIYNTNRNNELRITKDTLRYSTFGVPCSILIHLIYTSNGNGYSYLSASTGLTRATLSDWYTTTEIAIASPIQDDKKKVRKCIVVWYAKFCSH